MKAIITANVMNAFPDYSLPFHVYTDASDFQLRQNHKPLAYYSKKLTPAQKKYTTTKKELLAIVMTLITYQKLLYGSKIYLYTDHKNLTFKNFSVQCILHWPLFVDQFDCELRYIPGKENVLADCYLRLPQMEKPSVGTKELQGQGKLIDFNNIQLPKDEEEIIEGETFLSIAHKFCESIIHEQELDSSNNNDSFYQELQECLLNLPPLEEMDNPIITNNIVNHQSTDLPLQRKIISDPEHYQHQEIEGYEVIYTRSQDINGDVIWKIALPSTLPLQLLRWYHLVLGHCGQQQLYNTVCARFYSSNLQKAYIETVN